MDQIIQPEEAERRRHSEPPLSAEDTETHEISLVPTNDLSAVAGHVCVSYRGCLVCWGGYDDTDQTMKYRPASYIYVYPYALQGSNGVWLEIECTGDVPRSNCGASAVVFRDHMFVFGGAMLDESVFRRHINSCALMALDLRTGVWQVRHPKPDTKLPTPRDKTAAWLAHDKLYFFGGYGTSWRRLENLDDYYFGIHEFLEYEGHYCWNNQLLEFDVDRNVWNKVEHAGSVPTQRAASSAVYVEKLDKVFLFGGRHETVRLNDLYELDMKSKLWTFIDITPSPAGRSFSSFTLVSLSSEDRLHSTLPKRLWHCGCLIGRENGANDRGRGEEALLFYGGMDRSPNAPDPCVNTLIAHPLQPPPLYTLSLRSVAKHAIPVEGSVPKQVEKQFRTYQELRAAWLAGKRKQAQKIVHDSKSDKTPWLARIFGLISA
ncbi:Kelch motif family protein [Aphelenchoides avenae]|nr:Kelch motif family protein [Aphelenchus avenae]